PGTPVAIERLIDRMLAKSPADRPQTAREVATIFERALAEARTSEFETRELTEAPHSGETTIGRMREPDAQTTEVIAVADPNSGANPNLIGNGGAATTNIFPHVASAAPQTRRARSRLIPAALIALAVIVSGYGMYRYAFNAGRRASDQGETQDARSDPSPAPSATPTQGPVTASESSPSPAPSEGVVVTDKPVSVPSPDQEQATASRPASQ